MGTTVLMIGRMLLYVWVLPASLVGLVWVPLVWWQRGQIRWVDGVLEVTGGVVSRILLRGTPWLRSIAAITLGHVVLGATADDLEWTRAHERVHVRQYERWGPLFIPLYLLAGLWLMIRGRNPYFDNPFEVDARDQAGF